MATTAITAVTINDINTAGVGTPTAATSTTDGWLISGVNKSEKAIFVINATAAGTATVKAGNGVASVNDLILSLETGDNVFSVETSRFLNADEKIQIIPDATTHKIAVYQFR